MSRERIIEGLRWIVNDIEENGHYQVGYYANEIRNAITLLEPVKPEWRQGEAFCAACGRQLPKRRICKADYCPGCGKKVMWE